MSASAKPLGYVRHVDGEAYELSAGGVLWMILAVEPHELPPPGARRDQIVRAQERARGVLEAERARPVPRDPVDVLLVEFRVDEAREALRKNDIDGMLDILFGGAVPS